MIYYLTKLGSLDSCCILHFMLVLSLCNKHLQKLTGGVLLSRNKEYIIFYRGNDFITPKVRQILVEKQEQAITRQDEEELARLKASASITTIPNELKGPLVAGTLAETTEAKSRWGDSLNDKQREEEMKRLALMKHASLLRNLKRKLFLVCFSKSVPGTKFADFNFIIRFQGSITFRRCYSSYCA